MSNLELLNSDLKYLKDYGVNLEIYQNIRKANDFIVVSNLVQTHFEATELKQFLEDLKSEIANQVEEQAKKRRQFRSLLLEASEDIAKRFGKQVFTLSIGDNNE